MPVELIAAAGYLVHSGALSNAANHASSVAHSLGAKAQHALGKSGAKAGTGKGGASASAHVGDAGASAQASKGGASITAHIGHHTFHASTASMKLAKASHPHNSANAYATKLPPKYQPYLHQTAKGPGATAHKGGAPPGKAAQHGPPPGKAPAAATNWHHYAKGHAGKPPAAAAAAPAPKA